MPAPDSTVEEVRSSVLRYLRMYEEGKLTMADLAAELAAMTSPYEEAMGGVEDHYGELLRAALRFDVESKRDPLAPSQDLEQRLTGFRRKEAEWQV
jgi:hypothetical protein